MGRRVPLWTIAVGLLCTLAGLASCEDMGYLPEDEAIVVRVLVLNFDPVVHSASYTLLHEAMGWNDPRSLADEYMRDLMDATGGLIRTKLVDWRDVPAIPAKIDGFIYTLDEYMSCATAGSGFHVPDEADYPRMLREYGVTERIDSGEIDELWLFGAPGFGFWESAMAGPGAFTINGGVYDSVEASRPFAIMGFSYERGVAEMLHDLAHRTESSLSRVYGGWEVDVLDTNWARFAANAHQSKGEAGVGTCHYPANGESDYDYANPRTVLSTAEDWLRYPDLTGAKTQVSCESWGGPDYHRNYMRWFFAHLPRAEGRNADGRMNNWWEYVYRFCDYDAQGNPAD